MAVIQQATATVITVIKPSSREDIYRAVAFDS